MVHASIPQIRTTLQGNRTCNLDAMVLFSSKIECLTSRGGVECGVLAIIHLQDFGYLYDVTNETAGQFVPAQILYDAFYGRYKSGAGAIVFLVIIWGSFFFGGLSITTSAARVVSLHIDVNLPRTRKTLTLSWIL